MTSKNDVYLLKIYRFIVKLSIINFDIKQLDAIISFCWNGESRLILPNAMQTPRVESLHLYNSSLTLTMTKVISSAG
jgi:hypothetical protein